MPDRALILAPRGRDAAVARATLEEAGLRAEEVASVPALVDALAGDAGYAVVTEEELVAADLTALLAWREGQPEWSDFPFILLTARGGLERNPAAGRLFDLLGNVTFLERPFHPTTLVSLARSALRGRRKQYETRSRIEALNLSDERFRAAIGAIQGVLWTNSADGRMVGPQPSWSALTGQTEAEYRDFGWGDAVHPDDVQPTIDAWQDALARQGLFAFEHRVRRADGAWRNFSIRAVPVFSADGTLREWVGVHSDITEQRTAEQALRDLNATLAERVEAAVAERNILADIVETTDSYVSVIDRDFRWLAFNRALAAEFERVFGVVPTIGDSLLATLAHLPEQHDLLKERWGRALAGEQFTTADVFGDKGLDQSVYEQRWSPLRNANQEVVGAFTIGSDISERMRNAARLADAEDALRQSQKMEAIGQLTGGVAHDFNNLLTIIRSSGDLLRRPDLPEDRRARYVDAIIDTADRAAKLTHQLLTFSRRQALRPEVFDVANRLADITDMMRTVVGSRIALSIDADADLRVKSDAAQFETALVNLCVNARDAMDGEGQLTVTARRSKTAAPMVDIAVQDTGTGIPPEILPRLFEPFFTTKEIGKGTGLGLSQVYGFATQAGGAIVAENSGRGARMTLTLPLTDEPVQPGRPVAASSQKPRGGRILIVEDNDEIRGFAAQLLSDVGYQTDCAANAGEARATLAGAATTYDLLFTDVLMPGESGIDLARAVRTSHPALPIMLTSGFSDALAKAEGSEFPLLPKPYSSEQLIDAIEAALG